MSSRLVAGPALAILTGAAMLVAASSTPASAFTLSSPSLAQPVAAGDIEHVWWDRWGRWHPNWGYRRWGWGPGWGYRRWGWGPRYAYGFGPVRHCWRGYWGALHCTW